MSVLRPTVGVPITAEAACAPGEQTIGGGVRADATDPADMMDMHMQESGPSAVGWFGRVAAVAAFQPGSSLVLRITVYCLQP